MHHGLTSAEVLKKREQFGRNVITGVRKTSVLNMLLSQFLEPLVLILIASALIAILLSFTDHGQKGLVDGIIIIGIVLLNAGIGFFQEYKTDKALEALKKLVAPLAIAIRDGGKMQITAEEIVPGDILVLAPGDKISADGILVQCSELKSDESALTGESVPVDKKMHEQLFMGTTVVAGSGLMEVTKTGMRTEFGKIAHLTLETEEDTSPLQKELASMGIFVTKMTILLTGVLLVTEYFVQGRTILDSLLFSVSVAVAAVPEGLPATITVALALGVQKMAQKNAVVKKLSAIETLGAATVICSDKTGTLTKNEMTVTKLVLGLDKELGVTGAGYDPEDGHIESRDLGSEYLEVMKKIRLICLLCTDADLQKKDHRFVVLGDPTEGALITMARKKLSGNDQALTSEEHEVLDKIPFDSERKMMSVCLSTGTMLSKGSPDELIKRCDKVFYQGKIQPFRAELKTLAHEKNEQLASEALRVIGFAYRELPENPPKHLRDLEQDLVFLGLAGMIDPPREGVEKSVSFCHMAGIRTLIITGDHGLTAKAVAKKIGLANERTRVILGSEIEHMGESDLDQVLKKNAGHPRESSLIFSRVSPEHKRRVVDRLKQMGEVVAVTGDGVNDAPALKRADLGIAMGITGTEVSKETANMILLDDSFASIVMAIREGRKIYANLKKFTWFIFSTNIAELVAVFSAIFLPIPPPLTATLILAINVGTDILPAIALGVDHAEPDVMQKPPRDQNLRIMNRAFVTHFVLMGLFMGALVVALYFWKLWSLGFRLGMTLTPQLYPEVSTFAFAAMVLVQIFNSSSARSVSHSVFKLRSLGWLWGANFLSLLMVIAIVYLPSLQKVFHTAALESLDWLVIAGAGLLTVAVEELRKKFTS